MLTLVFGVLTVLGGVGTAALISYDVFLVDGAFARQSLYENRCYSAVDHADSFLRGNLANAGLLSDADGYDYSNIENSPTAVPGEESIPSFLKELSQDFSNEFTLDGFGCHLTVASDDTGEVHLENFALTYTDKPLYTAQSTRLYTLSDGSIYALTYTADLLQVETAPTYSYLLLVADGAHRPDYLPHRTIRTAGTVLLLLLHGLRRPLGRARGHPPDVAGQDPRRRVADRAAVYVFHWLGSVLL